MGMIAVSKIEVLTKNSDFHYIYSRGTAFTHPILVTYVKSNREGYVRYGITTSSKIGGAVERNRCRRIIKEAFATLSQSVAEGTDIVFVARSRTKTVKTKQVAKVMKAHLKSAGVLK